MFLCMTFVHQKIQQPSPVCPSSQPTVKRQYQEHTNPTAPALEKERKNIEILKKSNSATVAHFKINRSQSSGISKTTPVTVYFWSLLNVLL